MSGDEAATLLACGSDSSDSSSASNPSSDGGTSCTHVTITQSGCPGTLAESAWSKIQSTCSVSAADLDTTNKDSPTLTAAAKSKLCASCDCKNAVYDYADLYAHCTTSDQQNAAFAKNMSAISSSCL